MPVANAEPVRNEPQQAARRTHECCKGAEQAHAQALEARRVAPAARAGPAGLGEQRAEARDEQHEDEHRVEQRQQHQVGERELVHVVALRRVGEAVLEIVAHPAMLRIRHSLRDEDAEEEARRADLQTSEKYGVRAIDQA